MSWHGSILRGSWRGVPMRVLSVSMSAGRRSVLHEFPAQTLPMVEDLGRATRRWTVEAVVVGPNYLAERDELRQALEKPGAGELTLPTIGLVTASLAEPATFSERPDEAGLCRVSATFVEATSGLRVAVKVDPRATARQAIETARQTVTEATVAEIEAAQAAYESALGMPDALDAARESATPETVGLVALPSEVSGSVLDAVSNALETAVAAVESALQTLAAPVEAMAGIRARIREARASLETLAAAPDKAAEMVLDIVDEAVALAADASALSGWSIDTAARLLRLCAVVTPDGASELIHGAPDPIVAVAASPAPSALLDTLSSAAITRLRLAAWTLAVAEAALDTDCATSDSARALADAIDALSAAAIDARSDADNANTERLAIAQAVAMTGRLLREVAVDLPRLTAYVPPTTAPAVLIAHRLYGDANRADEIARLNRLPDPLRVTGGQALEVLADA